MSFTAVEKKVWIPEVSDENIRQLAERIRPVVRMARVKTRYKFYQFCMRVLMLPHKWGTWKKWAKGKLFYIKSVDLFEIAYLWDPRPTEPATKLKPLCEITTYHNYGYHGLFKPSIAEVLAQIPLKHLEIVCAFEIVKHPETADDLYQERAALDAGYHVATTRLYARA